MDPNGKPVSAIGGFSFRYKPISIDLAGHYGTERDPVTAATPIIFNPLQDLAYGAIGTVMIGIGSDWAIGVQSQWERMDSTTGNASYLNVGLGLQWSPSILR